ncbi:small membrane A-kinase anchor protein isoform X2 [Gallus gallus]|uniref:small membrane A-kinase anchor protein isoform X2 n=1 Tax=Gallus gallus TaxID=9031 RepID=UPI001F01599A|nr:small membrane A-kinase anchor protein isoform X2 [Gallus gallus]
MRTFFYASLHLVRNELCLAGSTEEGWQRGSVALTCKKSHRPDFAPGSPNHHSAALGAASFTAVSRSCLVEIAPEVKKHWWRQCNPWREAAELCSKGGSCFQEMETCC